MRTTDSELLADKLIISIVVRTQNRLNLLTRCLRSLHDQIRRPDEVVVVNDAGIPVNTVLENFSDLNIRLIQNQTQQGRARSGNLGVDAASGNVIGFLDDDDRFLRDHLQRLEQAMLEFDARVAYSGCRVVKRDITGKSAEVQESEVLEYNDPYDFSRLRYENYIPLINILIDRSLWTEIQGFDESFDLFEDWDMLIRLSQHSMFYYVNHITTEYGSWGGGQITHTANRSAWTAAYKKILEKHIVSLPETERLTVLEEYWRISQERRGRLTLNIRENRVLNRKLNRIIADYRRQLSELQYQNDNYTRSMNYINLLREIKYLAEHVVTRENMPVHQLLSNEPDGHSPAIQYYHTESVARIKRNLQNILYEFRKFSNSFTFSRWPLIRRYVWPLIRRHVRLLDAICDQLEEVVLNDEDLYPEKSCSCKDMKICTAMPMTVALGFSASAAMLMKDLNPTFVCLAGTGDQFETIDGDFRRGNIPFPLVSGAVLTFAVFSTLNNFSRVDILLSNGRKLVPSIVRLAIYETGIDHPIRISCITGMGIVDNYPVSFRFDPIENSARKTYRMELDSPDSVDRIFFTAYCHSRRSAKTLNPKPESTGTDFGINLMPAGLKDIFLCTPFSPRLTSLKPDMFFFIQGITKETLVTAVHRYLLRLGEAVDKSGCESSVFFSGNPGTDVQSYCANRHLPMENPKNLSEFLSAARQCHPVRWVWLCDIHAIPDADAVIHALDIFNTFPDAGMIIPMEKRTNQTIRTAYGQLLWDGMIDNPASNAPVDHPFHGYRRKSRASITHLAALRRASLDAVDPSLLSVYQTGIYQMADMIAQLNACRIESIYEPGVSFWNDMPTTDPDEESLEQDRLVYVSRWQATLSTFTFVLGSLNKNMSQSKRPSILLVDAGLPVWSDSSDAHRTIRLIKAIQDMDYQITFFPDNRQVAYEHRRSYETKGIEVFHGNYDINLLFSNRRFDRIWICGAETAHKYISTIRLLSPKSPIYYDAGEIGYFHMEQQAIMTGRPFLKKKAQAVKRMELSNCILSDKVIVSKEDDIHKLRTYLPHLDCAVLAGFEGLERNALNQLLMEI